MTSQHASQLERDLAATFGRRQVLGGLAFGFGGAVLAACGERAGAQVAAACDALPTETRGPFPADGSNGGARPVNVLAMAGVARRDIRPSFAGMDGRAEGVPLELELTVMRTGRCEPAEGLAVYLWQNDAAGAYSLYNLTEENYLRGLQSADAQGRLGFTSIVPGCYGGRYPHCHFEVFASAAAALAGERPLLVSQLALPAAECRAIYAEDARYGESLRNLERQPIERDFVFADTGAERQMLAMRGDPRNGYRGTLTIVA